MKITLTVITALVLSIIAGCNGAAGQKELFSVDFQNAQTLRYKFVSSREVSVVWNQSGRGAKAGKTKTDKFSETMVMVVAYTPVEIVPYGLTTVKATCESVKIKRSSRAGRRVTKKEAVKSLAGKTFTLTVDPAGKIEDYSQLNELIKDIGKKAFRSNRKGGRIKEPDMIGDFIATQWFLWDSISSIEKATEGVSVGQSWRSKLSVPAPMVLRKARAVTYTLDEIRQTPKGRLAVIRSSYSPAESVPHTWPIPYTGQFQMSGMFGLLRGYKILDLQGQGEELFNIDAGRIEQYNQEYRMQLDCSFPFGLSVKPRITIKQNLTMQILE